MIVSELALDIAEGSPYEAEDVEYLLQRCPPDAPPGLVRECVEILSEHHIPGTDLRNIADAMTVER